MKAKLTLAYYASLQDIRNYRFFYILVASILFTLSFVPPHDAVYSTISFRDWLPLFNSEWIGITTSIMSTIVLAILGFYLVIDNISKEKQYRTQEVIMVSPLSNFRYLLYRMFSGAMLLMSILVLSMIVSMLLSLYYNGYNDTNILDFVIPYLLISFPSAMVISTIAIILEVLLPQKRIIRYIIFVVGFVIYLESSYNSYANLIDPFGMKYSLQHMLDGVMDITKEELSGFSIGFTKNNTETIKQTFEYTGTEFSSHFVLTRVYLIMACILFIGLISPFFNRLSFFQKRIERSKDKLVTTVKNKQAKFNLESLALSPKLTSSSWGEHLLAEIYLYVKWTSPLVQLATIGLFFLSLFVSIEMAHRFVLPLLILLQVPVISDMITREKRLRTEVFFSTSVISSTYRILYKSIAALVVLSLLSTPLIIRYVIGADVFPIAAIVIGLALVVGVSFLFGLLFKSKKPFELFMILVSYACLNQMEVVDYLGIYNPTMNYLLLLSTLFLVITVLVYFLNSKIFSIDKF